MTKNVQLTREQLRWCYELAGKRYNRYANFSYEKYHNTPHGHLLGVVGELATYYFLLRNGVSAEAHFQENDGLPDITAKGRKIEVKTWADYNWSEYGRCVSEDQLTKIKDKDFIIWATSPHLPEEIEDSHEVTIRGYSLPVDFEDITPVKMGPRGILNRQLGNVRDIGILLASLR